MIPRQADDRINVLQNGVCLETKFAKIIEIKLNSGPPSDVNISDMYEYVVLSGKSAAPKMLSFSLENLTPHRCAIIIWPISCILTERMSGRR
jgi:hypothetical protein